MRWSTHYIESRSNFSLRTEGEKRQALESRGVVPGFWKALPEVQGDNMTQKILGIDFGLRQFAVVSDGAIFTVEGKRTLETEAAALDRLCRYILANCTIVAVKGLNGTEAVARYVSWFKKSMRRRDPNRTVRIITVTNNYPSSTLCSTCEHRHDRSREHLFKCESCGFEVDRDLNAAKNLALYALWHQN